MKNKDGKIFDKTFFRIENFFSTIEFSSLIFRLCSSLERWRKAEEAVENRIYEEGNVKATNLFPYQCGIT